jgi:Sulfotransferase domain
VSARSESHKLEVLAQFKEPLRRLQAGYGQVTAPLRGLPSALIIGAQKGGTTSLFSYLLEHPRVLPPLTKEVHYFDFNYARGLRWYRGNFPYAHRLRGGSLTLEGSPYYLVHPLVPARVAQLLPGIKLIAVLRNPVDRALSHYQHEVRGGRESLSFDEALDRESERLAGEEARLEQDPDYYSYNHHRYSYVRRGLYLEQLRRWARYFPRSQMLVLQSERLFRDPAGTTALVQEFLGLEPHPLHVERPFRQREYDRKLPGGRRAQLAAFFEPHNRELFQWLGQEFDWA